MQNQKEYSHIFIIIGAAFAFLAVASGAFGAHFLKDILDEYGLRIWEKAVFYQFIHSLAVIATGFLQQIYKELNLKWTGYSFIAGIILFSGSLYLLALTQIKILGVVTPLGGISFLLGWALIIFNLAKKSKN